MSNRSAFKNLIVNNNTGMVEFDPRELPEYNTVGYLENAKLTDNVNKPKHYTSGSIEVIDIIRDSSTPEQYEGFLSNNVKKYVLRYQHKNGIEDLRKAQVYLGWLIDHLGEKK